MPFIDGAVVLQPRIGACPRCIGDLLPQVSRVDPLRYAIVTALHKLPVTLVENSLQIFVADADRVVGILAGNCQICLGIPVGVVGLELDLGVALTRELDHPLDIVFRDHRAACRLDRLLQSAVGARVEAVIAVALVLTGGHDFAHVTLGIFEPATRAATFCSSTTFQST